MSPQPRRHRLIARLPRGQLRRLGLGSLGVVVVVAIRSRETHQGLVYPDGYQYLLMARGISQHARPLVQLGNRGDLFVPNLDASLKPLFPALVALVHWFGAGWLVAARGLSSAAAGATVVLGAFVGRRLTGSWSAGLVAGALCLLSPPLTYWSGFAGPDSLASALALGAVLLLLYHRAALAGVFVGACIATRPEYGAVAAVAAVAAVTVPQARVELVRTTTSALLTLAVVIAVVRPPLSAPETRIVVAAAIATLAAAGLASLAVRDIPAPAAWAGGAVILATAVWVQGVPGGLAALLHADPVTAAAGAAGLAIVLRDERLRRSALPLALAAVMLGVIYTVKNPTLERYFSQTTPLLALLAGLGVSKFPRPAISASAAAVTVLLAATLAPARPRAAEDAFATVAPEIRSTAGPIVTAAPDAYGFLLYPRSVRTMRPGEHGLVVLDAAQRLFEPELSAKGKVVARIPATDGLLRPDGRIDRRPTILIRGEVVGHTRTSRP